MKARGLLILLFGFVALGAAPSEAQAGARPASHLIVRPPIVAPLKSARAPYRWDCNRRRFAGGSFYGASWTGESPLPQPDAPSPDAAPAPVVNNVFVEAPAAAPSQESLGPRLIVVDRRALARPRRPAPLVIYGDARD